MGRLRDRVFDCRDLTVETEIKVCNQSIIPLMMYGSETWTLYCHHIKLLRTIQQRHLRSILNIRWDHPKGVKGMKDPGNEVGFKESRAPPS